MHREHLLKTRDSGIIPNKQLSVKEVLTLSEEELYHNLMCALKQLNIPAKMNNPKNAVINES